MKVTVLGVGRQGQDVARICATAGIDVSIHGEDATAAMDAVDAIVHHLDDGGPDNAGDLDATTGLNTAVSNADIVVETSIVDIGELTDRFSELESIADGETVLATSNPAVSVDEVIDGLQTPNRVVGFGFHQDRDLIEITATELTDEATIDLALSFAESLGFEAHAVGDTTGLVVDRLSLALEAEAMRLLEDGVASVETIDALIQTDAGDAVRPLERADRAGLDDRLEVLEYLTDAVGDRYEPPDILEERVAVGKTGLNVNEGFYVWENGEPTRSAVGESAVELSSVE